MIICEPDSKHYKHRTVFLDRLLLFTRTREFGQGHKNVPFVTKSDRHGPDGMVKRNYFKNFHSIKLWT